MGTKPLTDTELEVLERISSGERASPAPSFGAAVATATLIERGLLAYGPRWRFFGPRWLKPTRLGKRALRARRAPFRPRRVRGLRGRYPEPILRSFGRLIARAFKPRGRSRRRFWQ